MEQIDIPPDEKIEALSGIAYLLRHIASVILMCNVNDIGIALEDNITKSNFAGNQFRGRQLTQPVSDKEFEPNIYIYDNYPSGIGFSQVLYEKTQILLRETLKTIKNCECQYGCPSCVGPNINVKSHHKEYAKYILSVLLEQVYN